MVKHKVSAFDFFSLTKDQAANDCMIGMTIHSLCCTSYQHHCCPKSLFSLVTPEYTSPAFVSNCKVCS